MIKGQYNNERNMSFLLLLYTYTTSRIQLLISTQKLAMLLLLIGNGPRTKISEDNVEARRTSCLTTLTSHRSFRTTEILLASTTRSHWDAKVIYSSDRW